MTSHLLPQTLPWGKGSRALWAVNPNGDVFIFVHGFNGSPVESWSDFDRFLPERGNHDVVFFGYDSLRLRISVAATQLRDFLKELCERHAQTVNSSLEPELHRGASAITRRVFIIAHSLGAVIARRALLDIRNAKYSWAVRLRLLLFAPAHMGAHSVSLATAILGLIKLPIPAVARWRFPVLAELDEGSPFLRDLREETKTALAAGGADYLRAQLVAVCETDDVVVTQPFCPHDAPLTILQRDHTAICKPTDDYQDPFELVWAVAAGTP